MVDKRVYLIGSSKGRTMAAMVKRALREVPHPRKKIAATYAAIHDHAEGLSFMISMTAKLFGAEVQRFTVPGEKGSSMRPAQARAIVDAADIIFVAGGDPALGAKVLAAAGADAWLREARDRGATLMGISAGSIMLGAYWAEWPDEAPDPPDEHHGGSLVRCTGVVPDLVVDCHAEEDDWEELKLVRKMLGADGASTRFVGLPHDGGVIVDARGELEPVGKPPFALRGNNGRK